MLIQTRNNYNVAMFYCLDVLFARELTYDAALAFSSVRNPKLTACFGAAKRKSFVNIFRVAERRDSRDNTRFSEVAREALQRFVTTLTFCRDSI